MGGWGWDSCWARWAVVYTWLCVTDVQPAGGLRQEWQPRQGLVLLPAQGWGGGLHGDAAGEQSWWAPRRDSQENPWGQSSPAAEPAPGGVLNTPTQPGFPKSADSGVGALSPGESGRELSGGRGRPGGGMPRLLPPLLWALPLSAAGLKGQAGWDSTRGSGPATPSQGRRESPAGGHRASQVLPAQRTRPPTPQPAHENGHVHTVTHAHRLTPMHPHM